MDPSKDNTDDVTRETPANVLGELDEIVARGQEELAGLDSSARPGAGRASSAEPPPEIKQSARSPLPRPPAMSSSRRAARRPAASGTGCAASTTSIARVGAPWP